MEGDGGMSTKSVGGSDGSEVEAGALVSCDRYFRFRLQTFDSIRKKKPFKKHIQLVSSKLGRKAVG